MRHSVTTATAAAEPHQKTGLEPAPLAPLQQPTAIPAVQARRYSRESLEHVLSLTAIVGDLAMIVLGFVLANLMCYSALVPAWMASRPLPFVSESYARIMCGSAMVLWGLVGRDLYNYKNLLAPAKIWHRFIEALGFCMANRKSTRL